MKPTFAQLLNNISRWGTSTQMGVSQQKTIILCNRFLILGVIALSCVSVMFGVQAMYTNFYFTSVMALSALLMLYGNKKQLLYLTRIGIGFFPVVLTLMSIYTKILGESNFLTFVFPPRMFVLMLAVFPIFIRDPRSPLETLFGVLPGFLCLVFFEELHALAGIQIYELPVGRNVFAFRIAFILFLFTLIGLILSIQEVNHYFEKQIKNLLAVTQEKNEELNTQNEIILDKNQQIIESISYASRIQQAMLPTSVEMQQVFPENFVFFRPRELVSGDFYWVKQLQTSAKQRIVVAVDCTGHGVPGAFMSMIAHDLLNQIILEKEMTTPHLILQELNQGVRVALNQDVTQNRDGMDAGILVWDTAQGLLHFGGAKHNLFYIIGSNQVEIAGTKRSIGGLQLSKAPEFITHTISINSLAKPLICYLFSDGYADQFGGEFGKKLGSKKLKELLTSIAFLPMPQQAEKLETFMNQWQNNEAQVDDMLVLGIKIDES